MAALHDESAGIAFSPAPGAVSGRRPGAHIGSWNIQRWPSRSSTRYRRPPGPSSILPSMWAPSATACRMCASTSGTWTRTPSTTQGTRQPPICVGASLAMMGRRLVVGRRRGQHDQAVAGFQFGVTDQSVLTYEAMITSLAEAERLTQPIGGCAGILIGQHGDDCREEVAHGWVRSRSARTWRRPLAPASADRARCPAPRA